MDYLLDLDTRVFLYLNGIRSTGFDYIFSFLSHSMCFALVIIFVFYYLVIRHKEVKWWPFLLLVGLSFLFADRISVLCFKEVFQRLRPSHALEGVELIRLKGLAFEHGYKGGLYGFVSSHATNAFSLAMIFSILGRNHRGLIIFVLSWAALTSYSRIYVGVHYPGDLIFGTLLGLLIGYLIAKPYLWILKKIRN